MLSSGAVLFFGSVHFSNLVQCRVPFIHIAQRNFSTAFRFFVKKYESLSKCYVALVVTIIRLECSDS